MRIGAHVSTAGGIDKAIDRAQEIGAEAVQVFVSSPQSWGYRAIPGETIEAYKRKVSAAGIEPTFFHGVYLVNLATGNESNLGKGIESLKFYMDTAAALGALGVIFHVGSHGGVGFEKVLAQIVRSIQQVLGNSPGHPFLIMENSAGMGNHAGSKFSELGRIIRGVGSERLKVCLDTQHCFAAGYDVATEDGLKATLEDLDKEVGLANLVAVHANDSKGPLGSGVDRHENIGSGHIGVGGFATIVSNPAFANVPFLLEVPGHTNSGPDKENIDTLKAIRQLN